MIQLFEQILLALRIIALDFCGKLDNKTKKRVTLICLLAYEVLIQF